MRKLLRVNLSSGTIKEESIPQKTALDYVGGRGFGAKYLYAEVPAGTDPLGDKNKLLFVTGPLAGTNAQSVSKWVVVTKSPLTGTFTRSYGGGDFGAWLKWAGLEMVIVEGKAAKPSYLYIKDGKYQLLDAKDIQGKTTSQSQEYLRKQHGTKARMICIVPAAEKMVRYAGIFSGRRVAGRGGTGTVMASKNLKAIVVESERKEQLANPTEFKKLVQAGERLPGRPGVRAISRLRHAHGCRCPRFRYGYLPSAEFPVQYPGGLGETLLHAIRRHHQETLWLLRLHA
jgi:aldehyde:ferredoxin oxidoreductase